MLFPRKKKIRAQQIFKPPFNFAYLTTEERNFRSIFEYNPVSNKLALAVVILGNSRKFHSFALSEDGIHVVISWSTLDISTVYKDVLLIYVTDNKAVRPRNIVKFHRPSFSFCFGYTGAAKERWLSSSSMWLLMMKFGNCGRGARQTWRLGCDCTQG